MSEHEYEIVAVNGNMKLLRLMQEESEDYLVVGATQEEVAQAFPDYVPEKLAFFLYTYLIMENGVIHVKGPDGVDITKELYGEDVFERGIDGVKENEE